MSNVFTQTVVYLVLLFLGYGFKKAGIFKVDDTKFLKSVILYITNMISTNFFSLYATQRLGISDQYLAVFPILNAAVMLVFMVGVQPRMNSTKFLLPLWCGLALYALAIALLIFAPAGQLGFVILYVFIWAAGGALVAPRKDALIQLNINPQERARINALIMASTIAFSSPFGYLAGWLSSMDRRLPFVFMVILFFAAMVIVGRIQEPKLVQTDGGAADGKEKK